MPSHVTSDAVRLHVDVAGSDDAPTAVLVHGLAASVELGWRRPGVLGRLADAGLRTVAYDVRAHGESDAPHAHERYSEERLAADLGEIVDAFAGPDAIVAGYSMGAASTLVALASGLRVRGAVVGATPTAVFGWSAQDEEQRNTAVAVLEGREPPGAMQWWMDFLVATGVDKIGLAGVLRGTRPVIDDWPRITMPVIVAAGVDDVMAAPLVDLIARLPNAVALELPGDHISAAASPEFSNAIVRLARAHV